jgi:hypothetical protein
MSDSPARPPSGASLSEQAAERACRDVPVAYGLTQEDLHQRSTSAGARFVQAEVGTPCQA